MGEACAALGIGESRFFDQRARVAAGGAGACWSRGRRAGRPSPSRRSCPSEVQAPACSGCESWRPARRPSKCRRSWPERCRTCSGIGRGRGKKRRRQPASPRSACRRAGRKATAMSVMRRQVRRSSKSSGVRPKQSARGGVARACRAVQARGVPVAEVIRCLGVIGTDGPPLATRSPRVRRPPIAGVGRNARRAKSATQVYRFLRQSGTVDSLAAVRAAFPRFAVTT